MSVSYWWLCETVKGARREAHRGTDIVEREYSDTYAKAVTYTKPDGKDHCRITLVRETGTSGSIFADIYNGMLPIHFTDADGLIAAKVPSRFHKEVDRVKKGGAA